MAGIKITDLPAVASAQLTDVFPIDQGPVTYKESNSQLLTLFQANIVVTDANFSGVLSSSHGGTGVNNGSSTITLGGSLTTSGAFASTFTTTGITAVTFPTSGTLATTSQIPTGAALTEIDDTNVTLTLGGNPATALLNAASITAGWTGQLSGTRGGTGVNNGASTITIGGNVTFSGGFTFAGTITGNTAVTFPTSGTLATTAGTVSSVSGTADRITSTGGTTPVIDISASYVGQSSITTLGTIATGVWNGTVVGSTYGGTGVNNGASTITLGGSLTTSGAFASTFTMTGVTGVTFPTSGTLATTSQIPTGAALTKTDDTNITLTLGGSPSTALVNAASLTLGWTGQLAVSRGGTGISSFGTGIATWLGTPSSANLAAAMTDETGTGLLVFATSPTLTNPIIAQINDSNGNENLTLSGVASSVNFINIANSATGSDPVITSLGDDANVGYRFNTKGTGQLFINSANTTTPLVVSNGTAFQHATSFVFANTSASRSVTFPDATGTLLMTGQAISTVPSIAFSSTSGIIGTTTNDNAAAGSVGELIESTVNTVAITSGVTKDVTTISLTAGDWDVTGNMLTAPAGTTTTTQILIGIGTATASFTAYLYAASSVAAAGVSLGLVAPTRRISVSGTTTIYLVGYVAYSVSTLTVAGNIRARRVR